MQIGKIACVLTLLTSFVLYAEGEDPNIREPQRPISQGAKVFYKAKDYSHLLGMKGFSNEALKVHFKAYQGYVTNSNLLLNILEQYANDKKDRTPQYAELKRRLMWEFDGMRLHEDYFENLGGEGTVLDAKERLYQDLEKDFGSFESWKQDFIATGAIRGIGWAVLYRDPLSGKLLNLWINEHEQGHLTGGNPILIMDVFEHAYILDYGLDRMKYIEAFFNNIDWTVVAKRYSDLIRPA